MSRLSDLTSIHAETGRNLAHIQAGQICAALATPPGVSALAVIRLSGPGCAELLEPFFETAGSRFVPLSRMAGYTCAVGYLIDPADHKPIDQVVLTFFKAPNSYTGEDSVEISCHGGNAVKQAILDMLFALGIKPAEPGEFTRRAFLNGKLDLAQAEAVIDIIQADTLRSASNAAAHLHGSLSRQVRHMADAVYALLARVELLLEYPEHDEGGTAGHDLARDMVHTARLLQDKADSYRQGRLLREGMTVVLAGRPNAGKSSLLNALAGHERAIVTPVPGTTRDTIEAWIDLDGIPVRLIDTAGLRETGDEVERQGVGRARDALKSADLVLWLISMPAEDLAQDVQLMKQADCKVLQPLVSKEDLGASARLRSHLTELWPEGTILTCSAVTGEGIDQIRRLIVHHYQTLGSSDDELLVTNSRHRTCLDLAAGRVRQAADILEQGLTLDIAASLLRSCLESLAELTGDSVSEALIDTIFSRFCVGK